MQAQTAISVKNYLNREMLESRAHHCTLFINISNHQVVFLAADTNQKEVAGLCAIDAPQGHLFEKSLSDLRELFNRFEFFNKEFQAIHMVIETPHYTIVPEALFVSEKAASYLRLIHKISPAEGVYHTRSNERVTLFSVNQLFYQALKVMFPAATVQHYAATLIDSIFNSVSKNEKDILHVNLHSNYMDLVHIKNSQLQFYNTFPFEADTDIVYFILSVAEQQKMNHDRLGIILSGDISSSSSLVNMLRKYIPEVHLQKRPEEYTHPASFREFQEQQYYTSIAGLLCEL